MNAPVSALPQVVVIAASAGGLLALEEVLGALPADFPVPIAIVQHRTAKPPNLLEKVTATPPTECNRSRPRVES